MTADDDYCIWIINSFQNFRTLRVEKKYTVYHNKKSRKLWSLLQITLLPKSIFFPHKHVHFRFASNLNSIYYHIYNFSEHASKNLKKYLTYKPRHFVSNELNSNIQSFGRFLMHDMICLKQIKMKTFSRKTKSASISDKYTVKLDFNEAICI